MHLVYAPQPTPETAPAPRYLFADYRTALAPHTISRQDADLRSLGQYTHCVQCDAMCGVLYCFRMG